MRMTGSGLLASPRHQSGKALASLLITVKDIIASEMRQIIDIV